MLPRPVILFETDSRPRHYLPPEDVRLDLLTPTETSTGCPYKGFAHYWTGSANGEEHPDTAWGYDDPLPDSVPLEGLICFYDNRVDIEIGDPVIDEPAASLS